MSIITPMVRPMVRPMVTAMGEGGQRTPAQIIQSLFAAGQQGFWLPFTDSASLSQDSAGTLPYTALEQPVGRVLDRSGRGNRASQVTSAARGVVSARVNLLQATPVVSLYTPWTSTTGGVGATNNVITFDGQSKSISQSVTTFAGIGTAATASALLSGEGTIYIGIARSGGGAYEHTLLKVTLTETPQRVSVSHTILNAGQTGFAFSVGTSNDGTARIVTIGEPSLVYSNQASLPYQRVNTATDYDAVGFPKYLRLDGTDDFYTYENGGYVAGFFYSDAVRPTVISSEVVLISNASGGTGYYLTVQADGSVQLASGRGAGQFTLLKTTRKLVAGQLVVVQAWDDGVNLYVQLDSDTPVSMAAPLHYAGIPTKYLYSGSGGGNRFAGAVTEPICRIGPPPSAYERSVIRGYQMQKAGL